MKFLIYLKLNIYFVKTEENKLIYIIEISNYNPFIIDLIKNDNDNLKYCVLTDENFLIQTFTPNCIEDLKLNSEYVHSNFSIINYIKQFQEDYLTAINNTNITKYSHINKNEVNLEDKKTEKNLKNSIPPLLKKKIRNDLFLKKYSKKCKITWRICNELNYDTKIDPKNTSIKYLQQGNYDTNYKSNIFKSGKSDDIKNFEIDLYMEIKKIIIKQELLGYYFYFNKINKNNRINMQYIIQKNEINDSNNNLIQIKKYQCEFKSYYTNNDKEEEKVTIKNKQVSNSLIMKPTKIDYKNLKKKERKGSLDKISKVSFKEKGNRVVKINPLLVEKNKIQDNKNISNSVNGEYIPSFTSYFSLDINNLFFIKINENDEPTNYLEILKKEANDKIKEYEEQKLLSKESETSSNESEEMESDESSSENVSNSIINSSEENSNQKENSFNKDDKKDETRDSSKRLKRMKTKKANDQKEESNSLNSLKTNNSNKKLINNKNNLSNSYFKVNLSNIHYMVYDFYKDMVIDGKKTEVVSKIETIMNNSKNQTSLDFGKDERFSFISLFHPKNKNKKNNKDNTSKGNDLNNNIKNNEDENKKIINEEKLFEKKISEALKKQKDEPPIKRLKIFSIISFIVIIITGLLIIYLDNKYLNLINQTLYIIKNTIYVKYCSYISVYYMRELSLLNFYANGVKGGEYSEFPALDKNEYIDLIKEEIMKLFIENQESLKIIYSTSLPLSNSATTILSNTKLKIKMYKEPKVEISNVILVSLMQYNGAFNNLVTSTSPIEQNHPDLYNYIYNNLNGYKTGINHLISIYSNELEKYLKIIMIIVILFAIFIFIGFIVFYILVIINFLAAVEKRGNYMKVFYGINENILKIYIFNCENLMNKLKSSEEQRFHEEETINESIEEKITLENNQKINQKKKNYITKF